MANDKFNISFVGSGNVATQLALAFYSSGFKINQIYSRTYDNAKVLADRVNAQALDSITDLSDKADIIIIAANDDSINRITEEIDLSEVIIVHTSGSVNIDALSSNSNYGVFYPLQTLSKNELAEFSSIPILIEGSNESTANKLTQLAQSISENVSYLGSEQREQLHLAAVIANNFTNHLNTLVQSFCDEKGLDSNLLRPLIEKTSSKLLTQTGPAKRGDIKVLKNHMEMLEENPQIKDLYKSISNHILAYYGHKTKI